MAPKAKPKGKSKAKAEAASSKAEAKAAPKANAKAKAAPAPGSPAAGSGAAAVKQSRLDANATPEEVEAPEKSSVNATLPEAASSASPVAEPAVAATEADAAGKDVPVDSADIDAKIVKKVDLAEVPDPWRSISDDAALLKIKEEDWEVLEVGGDDPTAPAHLAARDADLTAFTPTAAHRLQLISADFAGNSFASVASLGGPLWLRALGLANNPLESLSGLPEFFPQLLALDVSFIELGGVDGAWQSLANCPRLRRLNIEGCSLASFEDMEPMPRLRGLDAQDNALEAIEDLEALKERCPDLEELDLRENDVVLESGYIKKVKAFFPKLTFLDNQSQKAYVAKRQDEAYKDITGMNKEIMAVDGMYKNESCSCLEGNPCIDPATCKDWKNREAIAREARKRKGLRDESGTQL